MADRIDRVVTVTITRQTQVPSEASFSEAMVASEFLEVDVTPTMTERIRWYSSLSDVGDAFGTTHTIYKMAEAKFAQNPSLQQIAVGRKLTGGDGAELWSAALAAIDAEDNTWYGLTCGTRVFAEQQEIADWVETQVKLCLLGSADANIIDSTGDIAEYLDTNSYERSGAFYDPLSNGTPSAAGTDNWPDSAWIGKMFPSDTIPGQSNWAEKTLAGVVVSNISDAQYVTALGKNCNLYQTVGGLSKTVMGTVGSGEYIDVVWATDWLNAHIQTLVYTPIATLPKVAFTDDGIQVIVGQLRTALQDGVDAGILAADPEFTIVYPRAADISAANKAARNLPGISFTATLAGAINTVVISGTLVL